MWCWFVFWELLNRTMTGPYVLLSNDGPLGGLVSLENADQFYGFRWCFHIPTEWIGFHMWFANCICMLAAPFVVYCFTKMVINEDR